ncbi:hypothetical protein ACFPPA_18175 [Rhodanobacter ginsengisoli]|uniref:Uncharacterized protein n=1 Tax=Rhodanobacter ginsengisoli TaxID=418646 RepID=A0ABW0QRU6_9GAMM
MLAGTPANQKNSRWLTWGRWLFFASGWVAAVFVGVLELPAKIVSFSENFAPAKETTLNAAIDYQKYVGRFSSDPNSWVGSNLVSDGTHPPDDGDIQLDIEYLGHGEYSGEIRSAYMAKHALAPWSRVMIDGKVGLTGTFQGVVWDIVNGSRASYALFQLSPEDKSNGSLRLTPTSANNIFPGKVVLWPTDFEMSGGEHGQRFENLLHEVVARPSKNENAKNVESKSDP